MHYWQMYMNLSFIVLSLKIPENFLIVNISQMLRNKAMDDNITLIPNDNKQEYPFCGLKTFGTNQSKSNKSNQSV